MSAKLQLRFDDLEVESFETTPGVGEGQDGTVVGLAGQNTDLSCFPVDCDLVEGASCGTACPNQTVGSTCGGSCGGSCVNTCLSTCGGTCSPSCSVSCGTVCATELLGPCDVPDI